MFCKNCGQEIENNAKFCKECGCANEISHFEENSEIPNGDAEEKTNKKGNGKHITTVIIAAVIVFAIALFAIVVSGGSNETVETGTIYASDSVIKWYSLGSVKDEYNLYNPYIENGYLYIDIEAQINATNTVQYRGFGSASVTDTYDKVVPIKYEYEQSTVTKGEYQDITIRIPLQDLEVQKPTTLYCELAVYYAGNQKNINLEFNISW